MKCNLVKKSFDKLLDNRLDEEKSIIINEHLSHCRSCKESFYQYLSLNELLKNEVEYKAPDGFAELIMSQVYKEKAPLKREKTSLRITRNYVNRQLGLSLVLASIVMAVLILSPVYTASNVDYTKPNYIYRVNQNSSELRKSLNTIERNIKNKLFFRSSDFN